MRVTDYSIATREDRMIPSCNLAHDAAHHVDQRDALGVAGGYAFSRRFAVMAFVPSPGAKPCRNNSTAMSANS